MKTTAIIAASLVLAGATGAAAQQPLTLEQKKQVAIRYYNAMNQGDVTTLKSLGRPDYIQHNPAAETGLDGLVAYMQARPPRPPGSPPIPPLEFKQVIAEGDMVMTLRRIPPAAGQPPEAERALIDIFRVQDGKVAEHWDYMEQFPRGNAPPKNGNGRF